MNNLKPSKELLIDRIIGMIDKIQSINSEDHIRPIQNKLFQLESKIEMITNLETLREIDRILSESMIDFRSLRMIEEAYEYIDSLVNHSQNFSEEKFINDRVNYDLKKEFVKKQTDYANVLLKKQNLDLKTKNMKTSDPEYCLAKSTYDQIEREIASYNKIFKVLYQKIQNSNITKDIIIQSISLDEIQKFNGLSYEHVEVMNNNLTKVYEAVENENKQYVSLDKDYGKLFEEIIRSNDIARIYQEEKTPELAYLRYQRIENEVLSASISELSQKINSLELKIDQKELSPNLNNIYQKIDESIKLAIDAYLAKTEISPKLVEKVEQFDKNIFSNDLKTIINGCISFDPPAIDVGYFKIRKFIELFFKYKKNMDFFKEPYISMTPKMRFSEVFNLSDSSVLSGIWGRCNEYIHANIKYFTSINNNPDYMKKILSTDMNDVIRIGAYLSKEEIDQINQEKKLAEISKPSIEIDSSKTVNLADYIGKIITGQITKVANKIDENKNFMYKFGFIKIVNCETEIYFNNNKIDFEPIVGQKVKFTLTSRIDKESSKISYIANSINLES
jgi:hypothetical protein